MASYTQNDNLKPIKFSNSLITKNDPKSADYFRPSRDKALGMPITVT